MKKFIFIFLFSLIALCSNAQFNAAKQDGVYLIESQNVHLEEGNCIATAEKVHNNQYAAKLYVYIRVTGWPIDEEWSNVHLIMYENGTEKEIDIKSLGSDIEAYNFFTVVTDGNTSYIRFSYLFYVDNWDYIYNLRWELKADKNGKSHHCIIGVKNGGIITGVNDIEVEQQDIYYDLMGHSSLVPFNGINIYKGKKFVK